MATKSEIAVHLIKSNLCYLTPGQLRWLIDECLDTLIQHAINCKK